MEQRRCIEDMMIVSHSPEHFSTHRVGGTLEVLAQMVGALCRLADEAPIL